MIELCEIECGGLLKIVNRLTSQHRAVNPARIILLRAEGLSQVEVARKVGGRQSAVSKWDARFRDRGLEGLDEAKRSDPKPSLSTEVRSPSSLAPLSRQRHA